MASKNRVNTNWSKVCEECGVMFFINRNESIKFFESSRKYCSRPCGAVVRSRTLKGRPNPYQKGKRRTNAEKEANRIAHLGEKSNFWKGGVSKIPGYYTHKALERYARLKGAVGTFSLQEWQELKEKHNNSCVHCGISEMFAKLTKDHIIPLTKGGTNYISNIQPLCQSCNSRKNNKLIYQHG